MDIKELKKLINEVKKEREVHKQQLAEAKARYVARDPYSISLFDNDVLNVLFNILATEGLPEQLEKAMSSLVQSAKQYEPYFNDLPSYFKALESEKEIKKRNAMLAYKLISARSGRKLIKDPEQKRALFSKLSDPKIAQSIEGVLYAMKLDPEEIQDFMFHVGELAKQQPKTNPGTPSTKQEQPPIDPTGKTRIKPAPSIPPQYQQTPNSTIKPR
jgi:hypothetical protein